MCRPYTKNDTNLHCEANVQQLLSFQTWASERGARILKISSINMDIFLVSSGISQILPILSSVEKFWKNALLAPLEKIFPTHMVQILFLDFWNFGFYNWTNSAVMLTKTIASSCQFLWNRVHFGMGQLLQALHGLSTTLLGKNYLVYKEN